MRELERVKQYVKKINEAQGTITEAKREVTLNKEVAARFVKHDLVTALLLTHSISPNR